MRLLEWFTRRKDVPDPEPDPDLEPAKVRLRQLEDKLRDQRTTDVMGDLADILKDSSL